MNSTEPGAEDAEAPVEHQAGCTGPARSTAVAELTASNVKLSEQSRRQVRLRASASEAWRFSISGHAAVAGSSLGSILNLLTQQLLSRKIGEWNLFMHREEHIWSSAGTRRDKSKIAASHTIPNALFHQRHPVEMSQTEQANLQKIELQQALYQP